MKRIVWMTDIHLNFLDRGGINRFCREIADADPDLALVAGDTGEARDFDSYLFAIEDALQRPIYFVLGNHDFYRGSIKGVRQKAAAISLSRPRLRWLPTAGVVPLTDNAALIGHDSWGDGLLGSGVRSQVVLNDFLFIEELAGKWRADLFERLKGLGEEAASHFEKHLPEAISRYRRLIVLVHVPPFREACWHEGRISDDDWLPHFTCHAVGKVLIRAMQDHPDHRMTVLCGHTHGAGTARILPNLEVITGGAEYGRPRIQKIIEIE
jgi:predicted MPP superfamily phosphohydrolase